MRPTGAQAKVSIKDTLSRRRAAYYENIPSLVRSAGGESRHIAKTIEYVTKSSLDRYREINDVRNSGFRSHRSASTGVISEALLRPEMRIDLDAIAVLVDQCRY
ncbi:hypothetical protein ACF1BQ_031080 [Bradyrhizobium sp. RDT10]